MKLVPCGLNGDWSVNAWEVFFPGQAEGRPNYRGGAVFIIDPEDADDHDARVVVRRWHVNDDGTGVNTAPGCPEPSEAELAEWDGANDLVIDLFCGNMVECERFVVTLAA